MGLISRSLSRGGRFSQNRAGRNAAASKPAAKQGANRYKPRSDAPKGKRKLSFPKLPGAGSWIACALLGLVLMAGLSFALLYGYRFLTRSPYFALKSIVIEGTFRLASREVLEIAGIASGRNSLDLSLDQMERRIAANPWVAKVSVKRVLPDGLRIVVQEWEPRFWVQYEGELWYADIYGERIAPVALPGGENKGAFSTFPKLEVASGAEDLAPLLPELVRGLTDARLAVDMAAVSMIRLSYGRGVEVHFETSRLVISLGQEDLKANITRLQAVLADLSRRGELPRVREVRADGPNVWVVRDRPVAWTPDARDMAAQSRMS